MVQARGLDSGRASRRSEQRGQSRTSHSLSTSSCSSRYRRREPEAEHLCERCRKIDFQRYICTPIDDQIDLGSWKIIHQKSEACAFCRLVGRALQEVIGRIPDRARLYLRNEESWRQCVVYAPYGKRIERYSTTKEITAAARAISGKQAYRLIVCCKNQTVGIQHIPSPKSRLNTRFFGRRVDQRYTNLSLIKSWLPRCRRVHGTLCEESGNAARRLPNIRVVDTYERVVITAPPLCQYVALSYVWGNHKQFQTKQVNIELDKSGNEVVILPNRLPQTIEDAIYVTRVLGERYLWVDALCIVQDNAADKHSQMLHMDAIYNSAHVTIAAASGNNANSGLAGVSKPRAVAQKTEIVKGLRFSVPLPTYMDLESDSSIYWNSRGWTFQEKILSKRLLLFTDYQVYFQCSNMVWCEDTAMETAGCPDTTEVNWKPLRWAADRTPRDLGDLGVNIHTVLAEFLTERLPSVLGPFRPLVETLAPLLRFNPHQLYSGLSKYISQKRKLGRFTSIARWATDRQMGQVALLAMNRVNFRTYTTAIEEFTRRTVSQREDGVHAVQGVLGTLTTQFGNFHSGLPEDYLGAALLWDARNNTVSRRLSSTDAPFPTWSWARWDLPSGCNWQTPKVSRAKVDQAFLMTSSTYVPLTTPASTTPHLPSRLAHSKLSQETQTLLGRFGHLLCICSESSVVYVGARITLLHEMMPDLVHEYLLTDQDDTVIGHIRLSESDRVACGRQPQELLSVSSSNGYNGPTIGCQYVPTKEVSRKVSGETVYTTTDMELSEYPMVHAFLFNWTGEVAERIALGHVVKPAWRSRSLRAKWTLLG